MKTTKSNSASLMSTAELPACRRCCRFAMLCVIGLLSFASNGDQGRATERPGQASTAGVSVTDTQAFPVVHIYFADRNGRYLQAEERIFSGAEREIDRGRAIVEALIKGPRPGLMRTIPAGTQLRAFYLAPGNRAYVDLSERITEQYPGGCKSEILTLYSIVNSLILNLPEVSTVKILVGGRDVSTLAGHIDIRYPFTADMSLIR
ncbi:MAG: GerMN domain-containing protein [Desulfobacterales bacterium]